jgi:hypothetical protein
LEEDTELPMEGADCSTSIEELVRFGIRDGGLGPRLLPLSPLTTAMVAGGWEPFMTWVEGAFGLGAVGGNLCDFLLQMVRLYIDNTTSSGILMHLQYATMSA